MINSYWLFLYAYVFIFSIYVAFNSHLLQPILLLSFITNLLS